MVRVSRLAAAVLLLAIALPAQSPAPALAVSAPSPGLYVPAAALLSGDGTLLWAKNPDVKRRPASTIKMLNALVVRETVPLDKVITISKKAAEVDSGAVGLKAGRKLTVRQLLGVMLVHSANGAAEALAIGIAGNENKYVKMMNAKAKQLGLKHTIAADPHGLSPKNVASAADLAVIARQLLADPVLASIVQQRVAWLPWGGYSTTDHLLGSYPGIEGVKTGYTDPAGYCFIGAAKRNGVQLIGVVLGAEVSNDRFTQMTKLLNWGFAHARERTMVLGGQQMGAVGVLGGVEPTITVRPAKAIAMATLDVGPQPSVVVSLPPTVRAPIDDGEILGSVKVVRGRKVLDSVALVADHAVPTPAPVVPPAESSSASQTSSAGGWPWSQIGAVWAGLGKMLGI